MDKKDFKWIVGILFGIISLLVIVVILIISYKLSNDRDMANIISIGSGLVSIVLGVVAIVYAFFQSKESSSQNIYLSNTIHEIDKRISRLDNIIDNIKLLDCNVKELKENSYNNFDKIVDMINNVSGYKNNNEIINKDLEEEIQDLYRELYKILDQLTPREYKILSLRFGVDDIGAKTRKEVVDSWNEQFMNSKITYNEVKRIETKALQKLGYVFLFDKLTEIQSKFEEIN